MVGGRLDAVETELPLPAEVDGLLGLCGHGQHDGKEEDFCSHIRFFYVNIGQQSYYFLQYSLMDTTFFLMDNMTVLVSYQVGGGRLILGR